MKRLDARPKWEANRIEFQRVHRIGKVKPEKPRPIIARFLRFSDRERVVRAGFQLNKDTGFKILEDFPQEIINRRRSQKSRLMEAARRLERRYPLVGVNRTSYT